LAWSSVAATCPDEHLRDVMLAEPEDVEARVLREDSFRDERADVLRLAEQLAVRTERHVPEAVDADHDLPPPRSGS
jgi:hypothetical protein